MVNPNLLLIDRDNQQFYCYPCERYFSTANGAHSHCRTAYVHRGEWCEQCEWLFVNEHALEASEANSSQHRASGSCDWNSGHGYACDDCSLDFSDSECLNDHELYHPSPPSPSLSPPPPPRRQNNGNANRNNNPSQAYDRQFQSSHRQPLRLNYGSNCYSNYHSDYHSNYYSQHYSNSVDCFGCNEQFATRSGMLMHLECGAGESRTELHDIDSWAFRGSDSYEYTCSWRDYYKYRCPNCDTKFRVVSAFVQHIEEQDCGQWIQGSVRRMLNSIEEKVHR